MSEPEVLEIIVTKHKVDLDPPVDVFRVKLNKEKRTWEGTFPTEETLRAFLKGVTAGCFMLGVHIPSVEVPCDITSVLSK